MSIQRIVQENVTEEDFDFHTKPQASNEFKSNENKLRPKSFQDYIGQERLKKQLKLAIEASKIRGDSIDHVLLHGPPGLGKTTMASVIATEMGSNLHLTAGPAIERAGDLASLLTKLQEGDVLFIDEIHRLSSSIEEVLYSAMEDYCLDIMLGKGPTARSMRLELPRFTLIGATTKTGSLAAPLRDRFGIIHQLEFYTEDEIVSILNRSSKILETDIDPEAAKLIASRSRLTPRIANRLLKRVRDFATIDSGKSDNKNKIKITPDLAFQALKLLEIDELGLDSTDLQLLNTILNNFNGGPVGLETLAAATAQDSATIEDYIEPFLLRTGFLERTPRGRKLTSKAMSHIKKSSIKLL
jgi:Holliday junction DNA helicase RuvB